jgi:hypothetical protein
MKLTQMEDIGGCRVLVRNQAQARALADRLLGNWHIKRFRDYVIKPKPSGYRALHLVEVRRDRPIEIQIRTPLQDRWANQVERDSRRLGVGFKSGAGVQVVHDYYVAVADLFALQESGGTADKEFLRRIAERFRAAEPYLEVGRP